MKNKLIRRIRVILVVAVVLIAVGMFLSAYITFRTAMTTDMVERSIGVKDYILSQLEHSDFAHIDEAGEAGIRANLHIQGILNDLRGVGNLKRLYIAGLDSDGNIVSSKRVLTDSPDSDYLPTGKLEDDLRHSYANRVPRFSNGVYQAEDGDIYYLFWPVVDSNREVLGVVSIEFDFSVIVDSRNRALAIALAMVVAMIVVVYTATRLSMTRATEPYFRELVYTDVLTGYENRMSFEHDLRLCDEFAECGLSVHMVVFDLNNLKTINDTLGHEAGDTYVANTANILVEILGGIGPLFRIGGDEFATLIVGKEPGEVETVLEALQSEKRAVYEDYPFSCAYGVAAFTAGVDETMRDVFKRADDEMYREKERQRAL